jgi:hypothetical protein
LSNLQHAIESSIKLLYPIEKELQVTDSPELSPESLVLAIEGFNTGIGDLDHGHEHPLAAMVFLVRRYGVQLPVAHGRLINGEVAADIIGEKDEILGMMLLVPQVEAAQVVLVIVVEPARVHADELSSALDAHGMAIKTFLINLAKSLLSCVSLFEYIANQQACSSLAIHRDA